MGGPIGLLIGGENERLPDTALDSKSPLSNCNYSREVVVDVPQNQNGSGIFSRGSLAGYKFFGDCTI